jgi:uncharacterized PurR-regulated membrane protein YhhQ (DUF165 family)
MADDEQAPSSDQPMVAEVRRWQEAQQRVGADAAQLAARPRRWREVWVAAAILLMVATLLAVWAVAAESQLPDCGSEDWAYLMLFTPILSGASVVAMTLVAAHAVEWDSWWGPFTIGRLLIIAVVLSVVVGPLLLIAVWYLWFVVTGVPVGAPPPARTAACVVSNVFNFGIMAIELPVAIGIATVLVPMWWRGRRR